MVNFKNSPSTETPINEDNLNKMQTDLEKSKVSKAGDTMSGTLEIISDDLYGFKKSRTIDGTKYTASLNVGSDGSARIILDKGLNRVAQLVIKEDGTVLSTDKKLLTADSIETIANNNGTAIKYPDGTMICTKKCVFENVSTTANGAIFISSQQTLGNFAVEFIDVPTMTLSKITNTGGWIFNHIQLTKSNAGNVFFATATAQNSKIFGCHLIAIGRWK